MKLVIELFNLAMISETQNAMYIRTWKVIEKYRLAWNLETILRHMQMWSAMCLVHQQRQKPAWLK